MSYLPFLRQLRLQNGTHIHFQSLPPSEKICACILHDDADFLRSMGAKEIPEASDRFSVFILEKDGQYIVFFETGMGTAQTSVIIFEIAAYISRSTPLIKLGTCGLLDSSIPLGSIITPSFAIAAEGISNWNTEEGSACFTENHLKQGTYCSTSPELLKKLLPSIPSSLNVLTNTGIITTDALYALYNQPNILSALQDYEWEGKKVSGIEMEVSSFFSSAKVCGNPAAAFIVGSWSLDHQLRFARGENPKRSAEDRHLVHLNEKTLLQVIIESTFQLNAKSVFEKESRQSPVFTLNGHLPPKLVIHKFFTDARTIHLGKEIPVRTHWMNLPVLAEGYAFIDTGTATFQKEALFSLAANGKTIICPSCTAEDADAFLHLIQELGGEHADECLLISCGDTIEVVNPLGAKTINSSNLVGTTLFVVFDSYMLRRYLHIEAQKQNRLLSSYLERTLPVQKVEFIGLGPANQYLDKDTVSTLIESEHIILFDRTLSNIVNHIDFKGTLHIIPYSYSDFSKNLLQINNMLTSLHAKGITDVKMLIEGNPEIYDFAEGLSMAHRVFTYREALPLIYISCKWIEAAFGLRILDPSYVLLSGFNARHGVITNDLLRTIDDFLDTKMTFMIMEMFCGDIPLVMNKLSECKTPKSVFVLTNMFSPEQKIWFIPSEKLNCGQWVDKIKGRFTTLVVVDNERLSSSNAQYRTILENFEAANEDVKIEIKPTINSSLLLLPAGNLVN